MRGPGWLFPTGKVYERDGGWFQDWRVRCWHPSFLTELWRMLDVQPKWLKPVVIPAIWAFAIWRSR